MDRAAVSEIVGRVFESRRGHWGARARRINQPGTGMTPTSVEPNVSTASEPAPATPVEGPAPWYRDQRRLGLILAGALVAIALVAYFIVASGRGKEAFAA